MKPNPVAVLFAAAGALGACTQETAPPPKAVETAPAAAPVAPPAPPIGYACESGKTVTVQYPDTATAQIAYQNQTYVLRLAPAASGARYAGSGLEWWTANRDGQESATLSRLGPNDDVGIAVLERCTRPSSGPLPPGGAPGDVAGGQPGGVLPPAGTTPGLTPAAPCRNSQLRLSNDGGDAGAGNRVLVVGVQNTGAQPCSLTGYPTVTLQDARGRNLTAVRSDPVPGPYYAGGRAPAPVNLPVRGKAFFDIAWSAMPHEAQGERTCPSAARLRVSAPGDPAAPATLDAPLAPCGGRIQVSPVRPTASSVAPTAAPAVPSRV